MPSGDAVKIFISHSHKDKLFVRFVEDVLKNGLYAKIKKTEIRFTSDEEMTIVTSQNNLQLFRDVKTSKIFISFISNNYKASEFCLLEMGVAHYSQNFTRNKTTIFPILPDGVKYNESLPNIPDRQHANIDSKRGLVELYKLSEEAGLPLIVKSKYLKLIDNFIKAYPQLKKKLFRSYTKRDYLFDVMLNSFATDSNVDFPITFFCHRKEYEKISINGANTAKNILLWTLFQSPLLVEKAYEGGKDFLTDYDIQFNEARAPQKFRLIVFKNYRMAYDYLKCRVPESKKLSEKKIHKRKLDFEKHNADCLFFTTKERLDSWYQGQHKGKRQIPENFDYEFGFISKDTANDKSSFGFTSGFHSDTLHKDGDYKHLILYPFDMNKNLNDKFSEKKNLEYKIFGDIPIQIEIVTALLDDTSTLRQKYVIGRKLTLSNIRKLLKR